MASVRGRMRRILAWLACIGVCGLGSPALSCVGPVAVSNTAAHYVAFAEDMVRQATSVEIVQVEQEAVYADPDLWRRYLASRQVEPLPMYVSAARVAEIARDLQRFSRQKVAARYKLRVVRRLKGAAPAFVYLVGAPSARVSPPSEQHRPPLTHFVQDGVAVPYDSAGARELSVDNLVYENSCSSSAVSFRKNAQYLVFRDAEGHLLGGVRFKGADRLATGYSVIELTPGGPMDWLLAVEAAAQAGK
jgi:hypothetical protein